MRNQLPSRGRQLIRSRPAPDAGNWRDQLISRTDLRLPVEEYNDIQGRGGPSGGQVEPPDRAILDYENFASPIARILSRSMPGVRRPRSPLPRKPVGLIGFIEEYLRVEFLYDTNRGQSLRRWALDRSCFGFDAISDPN